MSVEENKAIVRRFNEAYNSRNLDIFDELVAPDYIDHTHGIQGRENYKQLFTAIFQGFPDWHESIEGIIAEGDTVWGQIVATGTHTGVYDLFGIQFAPTGKKVTMSAVVIWRMVNGRITEGREVDDGVDFLRKLGLIEYTEKGRQLFGQDE
jgi:predicted ester cyclase